MLLLSFIFQLRILFQAPILYFLSTGEKSRYGEKNDVAQMQLFNQHRDRTDSGHTVLSVNTAPKDDGTKLSEKVDKRAMQLFSQGKIEEAAGFGLPVALGIMSERYYFGEDGKLNRTIATATLNWRHMT